MAISGLKNRLTSPFVTRRLPDAAGRAVLLTFDDGPTPCVTEGVLDRLDAHDARAVFFLVGERIAGREDLVREIADRGHALGNHSMTHPDARLPLPSAYAADASACDAEIRRAAGVQPAFFRAPEGRLHPASLLMPRQRGQRHLLWSLDCEDWRCRDEVCGRGTAARILERVTEGDVILLHDFAPYIHALLDKLLPALCEHGFDLGRGLDHLIPPEAPAP